MTRRLLAPLAALALFLSACGGDSTDDAAPAGDDTTTTSAASTESTDTTEAEGTTTTTAAGSGERRTLADIVPQSDSEEPARFEGTMTMVPSAGAAMTEPLEIQMSGAVDPASQAAQVSMDMGALFEAAMASEAGGELPPGFAEMFDQPLELITVGETSWIRHPLFGMMLGAGEGQWVEIPPDQAGSLTSDLGLGEQVTSPNAFLDQFRNADAEVEELGTETIRGTETTHYRLVVDVEALSQDLPEEERAQLQQQMGDIDELPIEVWVGEDGRLYRYRTELTGNAVAGQAQEVDSATMEVEFFDYGSDVGITAPPPDQVAQIEEPMAGAGAGTSTEGEG